MGIAGYGYFPAPVYLTLAERLPDATLTDAGAVTAALRMVKSPAELDLMRAASEISDRAMAAGLAEVHDGAAEIDVAAAAEEVIRRAGAEPSFVTEMGSGPRTALGTFLPGARKLAAGEFAVLDCGARVHGYHGDMCRTVVVGGASPAQAGKLEAVEAAVNETIAASRARRHRRGDPRRRCDRHRPRRIRRQLVGRVHATRKRRRPARGAKRQGASRSALARGDGALHRAGPHIRRRGRRDHRADDRGRRGGRRGAKRPTDRHVEPAMRLHVELPEADVTAEATLYDRAAPRVCAAIYAALSTPLDTLHITRLFRRP